MSFLHTNLNSLETIFPGFKETLSEIPGDSYEIMEARNGSPTLKKGGILLHSGHNPERESEKLISREIDSSTRYCLFLGFGLGYQVEAFHRFYPEIPFGIIEPDPALFKQALTSRDYTDLFQSGKMSLLLGSDPSAIPFFLNDVKTTKIQTCLIRSIYQTDQDSYDRLEKAVRDYIAKREINTNTHNRFNRLWISNIARNMPMLSRAPGIYHLKDRFTGYPGLLLAAGPGLNGLVPHLKELRERMLLICVDTALKPCLDAGVEPDFTILTDPQYWNTRHLDRCRLEKSLLVSDVSSYPSVFRKTRGKIFFCSTPFPLGQYLEERTEIKGKLKSGGSVATAAWDLIRQMGISDIFCGGLDLSFPDKQTHYRGSTFEERVHTLSHRFSTPETHGWHALYSGNPYRTENYRDQAVYTDQRMKIYISWFEQQMADYPRIHTGNLSDKGVKITGMPYQPPEKLMELPRCRDALDEILESLREVSVPVSPVQVKNVIFQLIEELQDLSELTNRGWEISRNIPENTVDSRTLKELETIDSKLLSSGNKEIIGFFILPLLEEFLAEASVQSSPSQSMENSRTLYRNLTESLNFQIKQLEKAKKTVFS